jgi:hypothetical protein
VQVYSTDQLKKGIRRAVETKIPDFLCRGQQELEYGTEKFLYTQLKNNQFDFQSDFIHVQSNERDSY